MTRLKGGCLCGEVRYEILGGPISQGICYCFQCQKTGGALGAPLLVVTSESFNFTGQTVHSYQTLSDDGSVVYRHFCEGCGTHVFATIEDVPGILTVRAGTLERFDCFTPMYLVYTENAIPSITLPVNVAKYLREAPLELVLKC